MSEPVRMAFVGDINGGDSFSLIRRGTGAMIDRHGSAFLDPRIIECLRSHNLVLGNIEGVLSDAGRRGNSLRRLHMRGRPSTCGLLAQWGLTVANVANNHILEQGYAAAMDTVTHLKEAGITVIGAGGEERFKPGFAFRRIKLSNTVFHLGGICLKKERYAFDGGASLQEIIDTVCKLKKDHPQEFVILSIHWGHEYIDYPSLWQRQTAKALCDSGVNLLIGHHPHTVQGIERVNKSVVAYSLGNFIFDGYSEMTKWSFILSVVINNGVIEEVKTIPVERQSDFRPALANGLTKQKYLMNIDRLNISCREPISDPADYEQRYQVQVQMLRQHSRKMLWRAMTRRFFTFPPVFWPQLLFRPIQRRLGAW